MGDGVSLEALVDDVDYSLGGESSQRARGENQTLLDELERRKRSRAMAVPTDDGRVKARLREIGEPITLFGERAPDRRDRLKYVLSQIQAARGGEEVLENGSDESSEDEEEFYTPGSAELLAARRRIAEFSLPRAKARLARQREESKLPLTRIIDIRKSVVSGVKKFCQLGSQIADERPISHIRFSPDGKHLITGSWSGGVKMWNIPSCTEQQRFQGHNGRVGGVAWHPHSTITQGEHSVNFATGGGDNDILLWSLVNEAPLARLGGHQDRVVRVAFHPSGYYLGSASYDGTWRLWDVSREQQMELLLQEGHSKEVYVVQFQDDGSLSASGGLDGIGRVWDLRTGRTAMVLDGHAQAIFAIDFSPNGFQIATGSGDDTIRIWDMRSLKALYTIPAHKSTVSDVRFFRRAHQTAPSPHPILADSVSQGPNVEQCHTDLQFTDGLYLVSSGYDGTVKIWSADEWQLAKTLSTDAGKVMTVDMSPGGAFIASGSWNRSIQLYACE